MTGVGRASLGTVARGPHHRLAAERVHVEHRHPESRDVRRGPFHRVRDVVQLRVRRTPGRETRCGAPPPGRAAQNSSNPTFSMPTCGPASVASRSASSRSDTSSATTSGFSGRGIMRRPPRRPRRPRTTVGTRSRPRTSAGRGQPLLLQVAHDPLRHGDGRARVDQGGRSHLDRPRPREHRFDRIVARSGCHPPRSTGDSGTARATSNTARSIIGLIAGPDRYPVTPPRDGPQLRRPHRHGGRRTTHRDPGDAGPHHGARDLAEVRRVHRQLREHRHQRHACHRARDLGGAIDVRAEDLPTELTIGPREIDLERRDLGPALQRPGEAHVFLQRRCRRSRPPRVSRSGPVAGSSSLDERVDARVLQTGRPHDPGGGLGDPRRGRPCDRPRAVMLRLTTAPTLRRSTRPLSSRPVPEQPAAIITGVGSTNPCRSTERVRFTPATVDPSYPGHDLVTGRPSGGVGSRVGASDSHRSHSTRAGLNTGPSMHDRTWS